MSTATMHVPSDDVALFEVDAMQRLTEIKEALVEVLGDLHKWKAKTALDAVKQQQDQITAIDDLIADLSDRAERAYLDWLLS